MTGAGGAFALPAAAGGYAIAQALFVSATVTPDAAGSATFARLYSAPVGGVAVAICDATVGTSNADIIVSDDSFDPSVPVQVLSVFTQLPVD
jgi:hypothetical protein